MWNVEVKEFLRQWCWGISAGEECETNHKHTQSHAHTHRHAHTHTLTHKELSISRSITPRPRRDSCRSPRHVVRLYLSWLLSLPFSGLHHLFICNTHIALSDSCHTITSQIPCWYRLSMRPRGTVYINTESNRTYFDGTYKRMHQLCSLTLSFVN